ncbi:MAG: hypothetical protein AB7Q17_08085 [Phycisphaerae bacterium]
MSTPPTDPHPTPLGSSTDPSTAPAGVLTVDAPCLHCGYNLRTLALDACCPECATPVRDSAAGVDLCFAPPDYVRRLARGAELLHAAAISIWAGLAISLLGHLFACAGLGVLLIALLLTIVGVFQLTTPDPRPFASQQHAALRRALRSGLLWIPALLLLGASSSLRFLTLRFAWLEGALWLATTVLLCGVIPLAFLYYLETVLARVPAFDLLRSLRGLRRLAIAAVALVFVAISPSLLPGAGARWAAPLDWLGVLGGVGLIGVLAWATAFAAAVARVLDAAATEAHSHELALARENPRTDVRNRRPPATSTRPA